MRSINEGLSPETLVAPLPSPLPPYPLPAAPLPREFNCFELAPNGPSDIVILSWLKGYEVVDIYKYFCLFNIYRIYLFDFKRYKYYEREP